ncbi:MAG: response regulator [Candidatus Omnitrophica bacterium]|nr:response regulator [Candidatus Omnitrophota bacterium]
MNDKETIKALVVDDEKVVRDFLVRFLNLKGVEAKAVEDGFKAVEAAKKEKFDIVFLELEMRGTDSPFLLRELKEINPQSKYVIMTAYLKEDLWEEAKKEGAGICLKKPFELDEIISEIDKVRYLKGLK